MKVRQFRREETAGAAGVEKRALEEVARLEMAGCAGMFPGADLTSDLLDSLVERGLLEALPLEPHPEFTEPGQEAGIGYALTVRGRAMLTGDRDNG